MNKKRLLLVLIAIIAVSLTARWWFPALLQMLQVNGEIIQAVDSLISIISSVITVIATIWGYVILREDKKETETLDQRNRRVMLNHVENFWVKGILEKSLYGTVPLKLGIKEEPGAVKAHPLGTKQEAVDNLLPADMSILDIFNQIGNGRSLLILGEPGSGKTIMLLELVRQLIESARQDSTEMIPVVFNLISWKEKQELEEWLAEQLNTIYYVPKHTAPDWIRKNKLILLLDGFDEVNSDIQKKCVEKINDFRQEHGLTSIVVCSRQQDYFNIEARLAFDGAIGIQHLTMDQVDKHLASFGNQYNGIKIALQKNNELQELVKAPLLLDIVKLAYQHKSDSDILNSLHNKDERNNLFDIYVKHLFARSKIARKSPFTDYASLRFLSWLARAMKDFGLSTYQIEVTQADWLEYDSHFYLYQAFVILAMGILFAFFGELFFAISNEISQGLSGKLLSLSVGAFTLNTNNMLGSYVVGGLLLAFTGWGFGWLLTKFGGEIEMVDKLEWSWNLKPLKMVSGLFFGVLTGLITWYVVTPIIGILFGSSWTLTQWITSGLSGRQIEKVAKPGQHLKNTLINAIFATILYAAIFGFSTGILIFSSHVGWVNGFIGGLSLGLFFGLFDGLTFGLSSLIRHFSLRFVLALNNLLPWKLIPFLDHCVDLIFLRRVGGGYIFVHRLLMEHFAEMDEETINRLAGIDNGKQAVIE